MQYILGLLLAGFGFLMVWKTDKFYEFFGPLPVAEKYIHSEGGSRMLYKLIGVVLIIVGFMIFTNLEQSFVLWIAQNFFGAVAPGQAPK